MFCTLGGMPSLFIAFLAAACTLSENFFHLLLAFWSFFSFLNALPKAAIPTFMPRAINEIVGAPPTRTGGPAGIGSTTLVGKTSDLILLFFFGLMRGIGGIPIS